MPPKVKTEAGATIKVKAEAKDKNEKEKPTRRTKATLRRNAITKRAGQLAARYDNEMFEYLSLPRANTTKLNQLIADEKVAVTAFEAKRTEDNRLKKVNATKARKREARNVNFERRRKKQFKANLLNPRSRLLTGLGKNARFLKSKISFPHLYVPGRQVTIAGSKLRGMLNKAGIIKLPPAALRLIGHLYVKRAQDLGAHLDLMTKFYRGPTRTVTNNADLRRMLKSFCPQTSVMEPPNFSELYREEEKRKEKAAGGGASEPAAAAAVAPKKATKAAPGKSTKAVAAAADDAMVE